MKLIQVYLSDADIEVLENISNIVLDNIDLMEDYNIRYEYNNLNKLILDLKNRLKEEK